MSSVSVLFSTQCSYYLQTGSGLVPKITMLFMKTLVEVSSLFEQGVGTMQGLARGRRGDWGLGGKDRGSSYLCVPIISLRVRVSLSGWKEFCVMRKTWSTDMWKEGNCSPRQQSSGELSAGLSLLFTLIIYQFITMSAFPNRQINRAETWNVSLSGSKMRH